VVALPWGSAVSTPEIPRALDLNIVRVERAAPDLTAAVLSASVNRLQGRLPQRRIEIWHEGETERLLPGLEAAGWAHDAILLMDHRGAVPAPPAIVADATPAELEPLRAEWIRDEWRDARDVDRVVADVARGDSRLREAVPWRAFCVRDGGRAVAMAWVLGGGDPLMVEDVYVTPSHRGRGLGAAVVCAAVAAARGAGAELVYLPTDANGQAQHFYRRLGFGDLARLGGFLRRP
jgi:GNAT superfamily N-acetyltransferase